MHPPPPPLPVSRATPPTSTLAIWSLILGILSFILVVPAFGGFVLGILAIHKIKRSNGALRGEGLAIAGLAMSCLCLLIGLSLAVAVWKAMHRPSSDQPLTEARRGFSTELVRKERIGLPADEPPADQLKLVRYRSPAGELVAYLSHIPNDGARHPAIVWLTGGFSNSISDTAWEPADESNDQSARFFREAGVVTLYPSLRGGNENPGFVEIAYGEVDDVLAATEFLAAQPGVDPQRIYLGGHSTSGTLALLVAEARPRFRAVFAFGPVARIADYGTDEFPFNADRARELDLRSPVKWLNAIEIPTFCIEGASGQSNVGAFGSLKRATKNPHIRFHPVPGKDHFSVLAPYSRIIAKQILADTAPEPNFQF